MKKIPTLLIAFGFVLSFGLTVLISSAVELGEEVPEEQNEEEVNDLLTQDYLCAETVASVAAEQTDAYAMFLDDYFQNIEESSDLVEDAMEYYRYVREAINTAFEENNIQDGNQTLESAAEELNYCLEVRDHWLDLAYVMMQAHALQSSNSKRTFKMIDYLKSLNERMDSFSNDFYRTFPAVFEKMDNGLSCFVPKCITR